MKRDPVCGMKVEPKSAAANTVFEDETYYFCSKGCKAAFEKEPGKFIGSDDSEEKNMHHGHH